MDCCGVVVDRCGSLWLVLVTTIDKQELGLSTEALIIKIFHRREFEKHEPTFRALALIINASVDKPDYCLSKLILYF